MYLILIGPANTGLVGMSALFPTQPVSYESYMETSPSVNPTLGELVEITFQKTRSDLEALLKEIHLIIPVYRSWVIILTDSPKERTSTARTSIRRMRSTIRNSLEPD